MWSFVSRFRHRNVVRGTAAVWLGTEASTSAVGQRSNGKAAQRRMVAHPFRRRSAGTVRKSVISPFPGEPRGRGIRGCTSGPIYRPGRPTFRESSHLSNRIRRH